MCGQLSTCYNSAVAAYEAKEAVVRLAEPGIQDEWRSAQRIDCLLSAFTKRNADLKTEINACVDKSHSVDDMKIFYYHKPDEPECAEGLTMPKPCTGGFRVKYMSGVPLHKDCQASCNVDGYEAQGETRDCGSRMELNYHYFPDKVHEGEMERPDWKFLESVYSCQDKCKKSEGCTRFTYEPNHQCHVNHEASADNLKTYTEQPGVMSGQPQCADGTRGALPKLKGHNVSCMTEGAMYTPLGWEGYSPQYFSTVVDCQAQCQLVDGCVAFTFMPKGSCYLHDSKAVRVSTFSGYVAGDRKCDHDCLVKGAYKMPDGSLGRKFKGVPNSLACHKKCVSSPECYAFTFFPSDTGECWLNRQGAVHTVAETTGVAGLSSCV
jgi:hypothetical protein